MEKQTILTEHLNYSENKRMYDEVCKQILSNKMILAWIMKGCTTEFRDIDASDIANRYIEGTPDIGSVSLVTGENIQGMNNEGRRIGEGRIFYDIRYRAIVPNKEETIELILNIEAQSHYNPGYPILKRAIYYASNMVSSRYG